MCRGHPSSHVHVFLITYLTMFLNLCCDGVITSDIGDMVGVRMTGDDGGYVSMCITENGEC